MNKHTRFSAIHWACVHGAEKIVNMLLENGAHYFLPDIDGYFPIDYAGLFQHENVIKLIIKWHLRNIRLIFKTVEVNRFGLNDFVESKLQELWNANQIKQDQLKNKRVQMQKEQIRIDIRNHHLSPSFKAGDKEIRRLGTQLTMAHASLFFSPIFNTRILYWACQCNSIELSAIRDILDFLEAYPEGPVSIESSRTPIHAAAKAGSIEKLKVLLSDVKNRYQAHLERSASQNTQSWYWELTEQEIKEFKFKKRNLYPCTDAEMQTDQIEAYGPSSQDMIREFYDQLAEYRAQALEDEINWAKMVANKALTNIPQMFIYDFGGKRGNTPLHVSSQFSQIECIKEMLKKEYRMKPDLRNQDGLMPLDFINSPEVKQLYKEYFKQQKKLAIGQDPLLKLQNSSASNVAVPGNFSALEIAPKLTQYKDERDELIKKVLIDKDELPFVPNLILKVAIGTIQKDQDYLSRSNLVNKMIKTLVKSKFSVTMFESLEPGIYFIGLQMTYQDIEKEARLMEYPIKLMDVDVKKVYNPAQRNLFEPFRSKDIYLILLNRLQRYFSLQQYQEKGIILSIIPMHDLSGIADVNAQWYKKGPYVEKSRMTCLRWFQTLLGLNLFKTMPLPLIPQFFKESSKYEYYELTSIKNYFGEKMAFHFAWMSFYTTWLIIPAIGGIIITIYHIIEGVDSTFNTLYALLVCIWVTVFIERWKRKSSEICLRWGITDFINNSDREERKDHLGYEYFSHDSHRVEKKTVHTRKMICGLTLQVPVFLILIGGCIGTFFAFQWIRTYRVENETYNSLIQIASGIVNTIIIMIFDFLYSYMATYSVNMENHKYQETYEQSYVYKIFTFKFVNTNIQIFYQAFYYQNFAEFYYMLLGMSITKCVTIFFLKHCKKLLIFQISKLRYFSRLESLARKQKEQQNIFSEQQSDMGKINVASKVNLGVKRNGEVFSLIDELNYPILQRHVMYAGRLEEKQKVFTDYIELNDMMINQQELVIINERSEVFILFSMATLYCCACPIVPLVVMIHNIIDMNMDLFISMTAVRRPTPQAATNIGPWLAIAEFMAVAAVISNCLLLFFSTDNLRVFFYQRFGKDYFEQINIMNYADMLLKQQGFVDQSTDNYYEVHLLWFLVAVEHCIILIKQYMAVLIPDTPQWVNRALVRVENVKEQLGQEEIKLERSEQLRVVEEVKKALKVQLEKKNAQMLEVQKAFALMEQKIGGNMERIRILEQEKKDIREQMNSAYATGSSQSEELKQKYNKEIERLQKELKDTQRKLLLEANSPKEEKTAGVLNLSQYLGISQNEWLAKNRKDYLEIELNKNLQRRLMHQSFVILERDIMSGRLSKVFDIKTNSSEAENMLTGGLQINCAQCQKKVAVLECVDCQDHFCKECSDSLHSNKEIAGGHNFLQLNVALAESGRKIQQQQMKWKKFEYFNFPVMADNAPFQQLQILFHYLSHRYLDQNYIEPETSKVNLQSLFINKNYEILTDIQAKVMKARDSRIFGATTTEKLIKSTESFNDEELFYINKIAFYLFMEKGTDLSFQQFAKILGAFQTGTLQQRCNLWLHILAKEFKSGDLEGNDLESHLAEYIPRKNIEEVIKFSFLQRRPDTAPHKLKTANQVLEVIFKQALIYAIEANPSANQNALEEQLKIKISSQQFWSVVERNDEVKEFISCLLQFRPSSSTVQVAQ